jgi:hypothetical protein
MKYVKGPRTPTGLNNTTRTPSDEPLEPILILLREPVGLLPAGFTYEIPRFEAERLIHRRVATAVGKLGTIPDLTLSDQECVEAGI